MTADSAPKPKRVRLNPDERRAALVAAAAEQFRRSGLPNTTTHDIARAAGVAPGLVYHYFPDKYALFDEAVVRPMRDMLLDLRTRLGAARTANLEEPIPLGQEFNEYILTQFLTLVPLLGMAIFSDPETGPETYRTILAPIHDGAWEEFRQWLAGFDHPPIDPEVLELAIFGIHFSIALDATARGRDIDIPAVAGQITQLIANGLRAAT